MSLPCTSITKTLLLIAGFAFFVPTLVFAQSETIAHYEVELTPHPDASFTVVETIYYDFARNYRHGIFREIPLRHPQVSSAFYKKRLIAIDVESVTVDDKPIKYSKEISGDVLQLKIGDPVQTMTSEHKFTVTYWVTGGLQYFDDGVPELYWDAIGTEWGVVIGRAIIRVTDPNNLLSGESSCYEGFSNATAGCGDRQESNDVYTYEISDLGEGKGVTVAFAYKSDIPVVIIEKVKWLIVIVPLSLVTLIGLLYSAYRYHTAFKTGRPIIAQYEPYEELPPMYTGVLFDDTLNPQDITAGIVYLAQLGYLKIRKTDRKAFFLITVDDYELELLKEPDQSLSSFQKDIISLLFKTATANSLVALSSLKVDKSKQRENQKIIKELTKVVKEDLVSQGYIQSKNFTDIWPYCLLGIASVGVIFFVLPPFVMFYAIFAVVVASVILGAVLRRRTRKGYEALDYLKGFNDFLSTTEKERYKFHNAPEKSPEQFMQYLPYAIAFGVEKQWAEVFKDVTIPDPDWYDGKSVGAFSAIDLSNSLGGFSTAFANSSGTSSSGGAGGGGSVGGGGGGGGGGSW